MQTIALLTLSLCFFCEISTYLLACLLTYFFEQAVRSLPPARKPAVSVSLNSATHILSSPLVRIVVATGSRRIPKMMCRSCIPLYGLLLSGTPGASSEMYPDPARYCKNYADEVGCRERHSGGLHCRDTSKCNLGNCSDADAARRVGMTCAGFPWWNGGWPLSSLHWDDEREFYECDTTASPSSTSDYCSQWITIEDSEDEWEVGVCKCTQGRNDNEFGRPYCANWTCEQVEVDKCKGSARMKVLRGVAVLGEGASLLLPESSDFTGGAPARLPICSRGLGRNDDDDRGVGQRG